MKKALPLIILVVLAVVALYIKNKNEETTTTDTTKGKTTTYTGRGLNRNPSHINYSNHAKCRMQCRHIDESEVKDMIANGKVNYNKSDLKGDDCHKRYAVEGYSKDNQHLRIIVAPCGSEETIVTVIDLGKEWQCDCPGDEEKH